MVACLMFKNTANSLPAASSTYTTTRSTLQLQVFLIPIFLGALYLFHILKIMIHEVHITLLTSIGSEVVTPVPRSSFKINHIKFLQNAESINLKPLATYEYNYVCFLIHNYSIPFLASAIFLFQEIRQFFWKFWLQHHLASEPLLQTECV